MSNGEWNMVWLFVRILKTVTDRKWLLYYISLFSNLLLLNVKSQVVHNMISAQDETSEGCNVLKNKM